MKKLLLTAAFTLAAGAAMAENTNGQQYCNPTKAEGQGFLTFKGSCAAGELYTGGYSTTTETETVDNGPCEPASVRTTTTTRERRGGTVVDRNVSEAPAI